MAAAALNSRAPAALQARPALAPRRAARRAAVAPRAVQEPERRSGMGGAVQQQAAGVRQQLDAVLQRYDFVSAGLGALAVTGFCVARGQDPATALWITAASTVVALVRRARQL